MLRALAFRRIARALRATESAIVFSVQHTGTWFAIEFLRGHPNVSGTFFEIRNLVSPSLPSIDDRSVLQVHLGTPVGEGTPRESEKFADEEALAIFAEAERAVVPLRDPLLSVLTRQNRHPWLDHRYIVSGFRALARAPEETIFLPVDTRPEERRRTLARVLARLGWPEAPEYVEGVARDWSKENTSGPSTLKKAYAEGRLDAIRSALPEEFDYLLDSRDEIVPFLRTQGYEDLPWWNL